MPRGILNPFLPKVGLVQDDETKNNSHAEPASNLPDHIGVLVNPVQDDGDAGCGGNIFREYNYVTHDKDASRGSAWQKNKI